jgi:hypothetical protein
MTLCCDECARSVYNRHPGLYQLLPVSAYADRYAVAREAMYATPQTVAGKVISEAPPMTGQEAVREIPAIEDALPASPATQPAPEPPRQRYSLLGFAQDGEPRQTLSRPQRTVLAASLLGACVVLGIALLSIGNHVSTYNDAGGTPLVVWGIFFVLMPLWAGAGWVIVKSAKFWAEQRRRYQEWKASLTPEQRAAVELGEAAAAVVATLEMIHHAREMGRRNTSSAMGYTMPDGHSPRPSQRLAALRQQTADHQAGLVPPPAGFSVHQTAREQFPADPNSAAHEALMRSHPEKRDPVTGQFNLR